ncbi:MAG TPA: hypothetical protein VFI78_00615 [Salinimicrobium sp.]|nr:hypothetical protein [Salinimicrobium sp.]
MEYEIDILNSAKKEIEKADDYYAEISNSLSNKFLRDLKMTLGYLEINPYFQRQYKNFWAVPFSKFPYLLSIKSMKAKKQSKIISRFHTSQNPGKHPK